MKMPYRFFAFLLAFSAMALAPSARSEEGAATARQRVVFQISENDPARWHLVLNNARNLQDEIGKDNVEVAIVAFGPGIQMFRFDSEVAGRLNDLGKKSVFLIGCQNSMRGQKLTMSDMHPVVKSVPSGVADIAKKQWAGWAYIRP